MQQAIDKLKPSGGLSQLIHIGFVTFLPLTLLVLVKLDFAFLAIGLVLVSKWRMFAVKPRFWLSHIRANSVDILVGISIVLILAHNSSFAIQIAWIVGYVVWLTLIKPGTTIAMNTLQSMLAALLSLVVLFMIAGDSPLALLVVVSGAICYVTAHHFLDSFDEPFTKFLAYMWAFMGASLVWIFGHWLLFYGILAQPALIILVIGYGLGGIYFFDHKDKLSRIIKLEFTFIVVVILLINLVALAISSSSSSIV